MYRGPALIIRTIASSDIAYLASSFHHALIRMKPYCDKLQHLAHTEIQEQFEWLLKNCQVTIASSAKDTDHIVGWCVTAPDSSLVWVYVRKTYWGTGVAKELLTEQQLKELKEQR